MLMDAWQRENYERNIKLTPVCNICNEGQNKIESIYGLHIVSKWSRYDLGRLDEVNYCPKCGKKLLR